MSDEEEFFDVEDDGDDYHDANERQSNDQPSTSYAAPLPGATAAAQYPAHSAAFEGRIPEMLQIVKQWSAEKRSQFDPQGNTVLHVAILVQNQAAVAALLDAGFSSFDRNSRRWTAFDEAIATKHPGITKLLYTHAYAFKKRRMKEKKVQMLTTCNELPNYSVKVSWQLCSPVFGLVLRRYAPSDTYQVWKRDSSMRVDGTLMGMDEDNKKMIPQWRRGHFSLLFDASTQPASVFICDHEKKLYANMASQKKVRDVDAEVEAAIHDGAGKTKFETQDFRLKPQKTMFGYDSTEKVEGWTCRIFEANGRMIGMEHLKASLVIPKGATFAEYLSLSLPEDQVTEIPLSLKAMQATSSKKSKERGVALTDAEKAEAETVEALKDVKVSPRTPSKPDDMKKRGRKISAKCWMATKFPMSLRQLLPVMDVIGHANKHLAKVTKFLRKYGDMELFPVRFQIPLMMTVYLMVSFKDFVMPAPGDSANSVEFYSVPADYTEANLKDIFGGKGGAFADEDEDDIIDYM
ncbi:hypothetical protein ABBQ38_002745 [Trebouxia sp. C0009 RCD-2024]